MSKSKTLSELCSTLQVSRRAIQGYEKTGLVVASGKNKYGHLLYDAVAEERIRRIKLYQQLGFRLKEIKEIMDAPNQIVKAAISQQIENLQCEIYLKREVIREAEELIGQL